MMPKNRHRTDHESTYTFNDVYLSQVPLGRDTHSLVIAWKCSEVNRDRHEGSQDNRHQGTDNNSDILANKGSKTRMHDLYLLKVTHAYLTQPKMNGL